MPVVVATFVPKPEHFDEVLAAFAEAIPLVHDEPGCRLYALHTAKGRIVMVEDWESGEALAAHGAGPAFAALNKRLDGLIDGRPEIVFLSPVPAGDPAKGQLHP